MKNGQNLSSCGVPEEFWSAETGINVVILRLMIKSSTSATSLNPGEGPPVEQEARGAEAEVVIIRPLERDGAHHGLGPAHVEAEEEEAGPRHHLAVQQRVGSRVQAHRGGGAHFRGHWGQFMKGLELEKGPCEDL